MAVVEVNKKYNFKVIQIYCGVDVLNFPIYVTHYVQLRKEENKWP